MNADHQSTALVIQMMPLLMREYHLRLDADLFFADRRYADSVIGMAADEKASERLRGLAECLRPRLMRMTAGPKGAARSLPPAVPEAPPAALAQDVPAAPAGARAAEDVDAARRYVRSLR